MKASVYNVIKGYKKLFLVLSALSFLPMVVNAQQTKYINYFSAGGDICLPVKVKHSRGEFFVIENNQRVDGPIDYVEAWDCQGRKILDTTPDRGGGYSTDKSKPIVYYWVFEHLYPTSEDIKETSEDVKTDIKRQVITSTGSIIGSTVKTVWGGSGYAVDGYPNFQLCLGASRAYGEFARAKLCFGDDMGGILYGGVGKDWWFDGDNKDKMSWHAGIGCYFSVCTFDDEDSDFSIGLTYADSPVQKGGIVMIDLSYSLFFGRSRRFGLFVGGGGGIGKVHELFKDWGYSWSEVKPNFIWDANVGIAVKLWEE